MATKNHLSKSKVVEELPRACCDERAAVEFLEARRWVGMPCCPHCGSTTVYMMKDEKTGERNKRFLWRCRDCKKQFTIRVGSIAEDSAIPLHKWCRAYWMASSGKNGVSALELSRTLQVSYKSALFVMKRLRHAMADAPKNPPKMRGTVEADETYVGGKPRYKGTMKNPINSFGHGTKKTPVFAALERNGKVRSRVMPTVNQNNIHSALREWVDPSARVVTDELRVYNGPWAYFRGGHETINHGSKQYSRKAADGSTVTTNGVEGFFARVKRGVSGVYHNVSKEHLHRYMNHFDWLHNSRTLNDGERAVDLIRRSEGRRLTYRESVA